MKFQGHGIKRDREVAPLAGARIEIKSRARLKDPVVVAPLAGARIEIVCKHKSTLSQLVAPLAGARIEILKTVRSMEIKQRRSPRGSAD